MTFRDVVGHRGVIDLLTRAVSRGSLPASLIFSGPAGVGKATLALALGQFINCERAGIGSASAAPTGQDACGECATCQRLARAAAAFQSGGEKAAVDCLQWLAPDERGSIRIEAVRDVLERAGFRPFDGRQRIVIVDDAQTLVVPAQQALLKMLEEPPPATRFVLVTAQPDALLPTVRSRCPQLRFGPVSVTDLTDALIHRYGWMPDEAKAAAAVAEGQLGRALERDDTSLTDARNVAADILEHVTASRGPVDRLEAAQHLVARGETTRSRSDTTRSRGSAVTRQQISARLDAMAALLRDIGILLTRADRRRLANADLSSRLERMAAAFDTARLTRAFSVVDQARDAINRNAGQKIVADWLALNL